MEMLRQKLSLLPEKPGVYLMKDSSGKIIYVGKAKVLKNRVRSYFTGSHDGKTQKMIGNIADFEYMVTDSEVEALVLECNLIKKHNPKFNVLLRDDKSYPYLTITEETHPRIMVTRQIKPGNGKYFGPYPNATAAREAARLLNRLFPFRKCRQIPHRPCLYFHLEQCLGPCCQSIPPQSYEEMRKEVTKFLKGGQEKIVQLLEEKMLSASDSLRFELAQEYRDLINSLKALAEKQNITLTDFTDRDVLGYATSADLMCVQIFYLRQGKLLARDSFVFPYYAEAEDAFISFVAQFYSEHPVWPQEILLPPCDTEALGRLFPVGVPKRGQKRDLVELATTNAQTTIHDEVSLEAKRAEEIKQALATLAELLNLPDVSLIEAFDISNTAGTNPVAGMVQFLHGKPNRTGYRKFGIQPMETSDDTASLRQVVERRYARLLAEAAPFPDLILVDGGKGQIRAACQALDKLALTLPVAGLVKDDRHRTAGLLNMEGDLLPLPHNSPLFHLLERIQDEVHRFAITFHRQQRAKKMILSALDGIPGIGPRRRQLLLRHFQSVEAIRLAGLPELLAAGLPQNTAQAVYDFFRQQQAAAVQSEVPAESPPG
ncbi:excinuclease ABC subunit UvrC [Acididesulfobacillus acetoxydans]|nr:excinuclease ABC subunit UvrC [Acididesulfobacillus acetoxydans]